MNQAPHLLVVMPFNIGGAILATPVLERLHQRFPDADIDIVAHPRSSELFRLCPFRSQLIGWDSRHDWRSTWRLIQQLRRSYYDIVVDLRTAALGLALRAGKRFTLWRARPLGPHAVERHMGVIAPIADVIPPTKVWLSDALQTYAYNRLRVLPPGRRLALGVGAGVESRIWPQKRFLDLARCLERDFSSVVLLGGPADRKRGMHIAGLLRLPCLDLTGRTSLLQAGAVLAQTRAFVGNDSGLGHLASAVGTATLVVFGPGNPDRYRPWNSWGTWMQARDGRLDTLDASPVADHLRMHLARLDVLTPYCSEVARRRCVNVD